MFSGRFHAVLAAMLTAGFLVVMPGCDWLKGSGSDTRLSPYLTKLSISPSSVLIGQTFTISFRYDDPQGDVALARVSFQRDGDAGVREEAPPWPETISKSSGTASFPLTFGIGSKGGFYTVRVKVEDSRGHASNTLSGNIRLNAPD